MSRAQANALRSTEVLMIEDDPSDAYLVGNALDNLCPGEFALAHARSLEEGLPQLSGQRFDVALLDLSLPGLSELDALKQLRHASPQLPIVILSGHNNERLALSAMQQGAQDYLVKEQADGHLIKRAITYAIERKRFEDNLTMLANYDLLTGLANRCLFESRVEMALTRARRSGETPAVFFLDLNHFKAVNDRLGHAAGDALLKGVAMRLQRTLRQCDTVARFGGDEFAVLLEGMTDARNLAMVAQKIIGQLHTPFALEEGEASVGVSIGIATFQPDIGLVQLLKQADIAMYRAKQQPDSNYQFYTETLHRQASERLRLEDEFQHAIRSHTPSLCLYYQPKLDLKSGRLAGAEALIRWDHPTRGLLLPGEFLPLIPLAMTGELDRFVLETVCRDLQCWHAAGMVPVQVSVHLSNHCWEDEANIAALADILKKSGLWPQSLAFEIEEDVLLQQKNDALASIARAHEAGVAIHLDNFGAAWSSLTLLARCPLDTIKIDRRLTGEIDHKEQASLLRALITLGHELGMTLVAEGVETASQQRALAEMSCDQAQGMVISRPLPAPEFFQWLAGRHFSATAE